MWIAIWVLLAIFVMGVFGWSSIILLQQKKSWKNYAEKSGLTYAAGGLMGSPTLSGALGGYNISFFSEEKKTEDLRGQRFSTVIELEMGKGFPVGAAIATKEYAGFLSSLLMDQTQSIESKNWDSSYIIRTTDADLLAAFLTEKRTDILHSLFTMSNSMTLFFFDELESVLRIETSDPLRNPDHMEKIVKRVLRTADTLSLTKDEKAQGFKKIKSKAPKVAVPDVEDTGLELEDDEGSQETGDIKKP